jgi:hypothetical protein
VPARNSLQIGSSLAVRTVALYRYNSFASATQNDCYFLPVREAVRRNDLDKRSEQNKNHESAQNIQHKEQKVFGDEIVPYGQETRMGLRWHNLRFPRFSSNRFR